MAIVEMWWGSTEYGNVTPSIKLELGPAGYSLQGSLANEQPLVVTAHYFISPNRMNFGNPRCVSQPAALFSGKLTAKTSESLIGDGDPRITVKHTLRQRVFLGGRQISQSDVEHVLIDVKGDNKSKTVDLGALPFNPVTFTTTPNTELRIDLVVELDPWYHKTRHGGATYQGLLQLPQWGLIHGVSG